MTKKPRKSLKPVGTRPGIMYGPCKVHKASVGNCPPFRRILSALNTPTYKLAKFLVPILRSLTNNEFTDLKILFILLAKLFINNMISLWVVWM